ncbi:HEPN domain-containing protein [Pseudomonas sp. GD03862]|uniref:MAE_28990/MAE_18760 family HEPN-like nuclease n=1 Tax=Pseudomonas sp. GD03862 TaxID=2975391 RepID=UPI00244CDB14|nr:MAE_28990/MAE_18760 family HEPN-like nuclease [Pseudomonas sp. GD03862]MDH0708112.1 HEPN domain-containing protein [Pseudomonas sp. GD03862]
MICQLAREGANDRLSEARILYSSIKSIELVDDAPQPVTPMSLTLRGLIYVSLYGAIEYTVTQGVQQFIVHLCGLNVQTAHLEQALYSIALDSQLKSAREGSEKNKWNARREIFSSQFSSSFCDIPDTVFGSYLHNVYPKTVLEIFQCLGIVRPATQHPSEVGYFREITEKRNAVAHGRESASNAGRSLSLNELEIRLNAVYSICSYFLDVLEEQALNLGFVKADHRASYAS